MFQISAILTLALAISGSAISGGSLLQQAPRGAADLVNPYAGTESARRAGAKLYGRECSFCHGESGEGIGHATPLASPLVKRSSPGAIFWVLRNGAVFRGMPSFSHLPEQQRWQIVTFLLSGGPGASPRRYNIFHGAH